MIIYVQEKKLKFFKRKILIFRRLDDIEEFYYQHVGHSTRGKRKSKEKKYRIQQNDR